MACGAARDFGECLEHGPEFVRHCSGLAWSACRRASTQVGSRITIIGARHGVTLMLDIILCVATSHRSRCRGR
eukprot:5874626-Amphidinium_carterae.2